MLVLTIGPTKNRENIIIPKYLNQGRLQALWNGRQNFYKDICRSETSMLTVKSNVKVSNNNNVPLDFTGSVKVSDLQMSACQNSEVHSRELLSFID